MEEHNKCSTALPVFDMANHASQLNMSSADSRHHPHQRVEQICCCDECVGANTQSQHAPPQHPQQNQKRFSSQFNQFAVSSHAGNGASIPKFGALTANSSLLWRSRSFASGLSPVHLTTPTSSATAPTSNSMQNASNLALYPAKSAYLTSTPFDRHKFAVIDEYEARPAFANRHSSTVSHPFSSANPDGRDGQHTLARHASNASESSVTNHQPHNWTAGSSGLNQRGMLSLNSSQNSAGHSNRTGSQCSDDQSPSGTLHNRMADDFLPRNAMRHSQSDHSYLNLKARSSSASTNSNVLVTSTHAPSSTATINGQSTLDASSLSSLGSSASGSLSRSKRSLVYSD